MNTNWVLSVHGPCAKPFTWIVPLNLHVKPYKELSLLVAKWIKAPGRDDADSPVKAGETWSNFCHYHRSPFLLERQLCMKLRDSRARQPEFKSQPSHSVVEGWVTEFTSLHSLCPALSHKLC